MRRLPVYFVIDVSESMVGEPLKHVEDGLRTIISQLKKDPHALETVYISIIVFAGKAKTLVPLTDIITFYPPKISIGAGTSYGSALKHLTQCINTDVKQSTYEQKGDWKPIVFFMTDGNPTDDYVLDLGLWEQKWKDKTNCIVVSIGNHVNTSIVKRISDNIISFDDSDADSYIEFFKWVTSSIKMQSQKVDSNDGDADLGVTGFDKSKLKKIEKFDESQVGITDEQFAIFTGICQTTRNKYLIKYKKGTEQIGFVDMPDLAVQNFRLEGSYQIDNSYEELSTADSMATKSSVSTEHLRGMPNCPCCGNRFAMAICSCNEIFCLDNGGAQTCPHCNQIGNYGSGDGHIDINRQQG